ncbi:hypothetical protein B5F82_04280 [Megamonas hypermegale]|jgi:hypothetical protein|uniref:CRISPR-associated protein, TM1812 family n=1 Tax=Megamonas hypermegale TaxID=158847 RepID=A0A239U5E3_9FIRM|nr:TM1812 family CRISPR-associated protein [Megamonas hypermegale]OUO40390.1 hypothetical protein B5F82_04280 [Megamonas hypermegale]SNV05176.1 CRISPR-associated protein, TM1812 family [Megamonas hypermegale]
MRKVFLSSMLLNELKPEDPTYYTSDDFELSENRYDFPMTYLIDDKVKANDEIVIITAIQQDSGNNVNNATVNYKKYKAEVEKILQERNVNFKFEEIMLTENFDSLTFNKFFKQVAVLINDNDQLFVDVTFGMKPYCISLFVAVAYAEKAARNVDVDTVIYAQKYSGFSRAKTAEEKAKDPSKSRIYDITGLFYLNAIAGNAKPGQKHKLDKALDLLIND